MSAARIARVVQIDYDGRRFTFYIDHDPPLVFWRVESDRATWLSPLMVEYDEQSDFFQQLAEIAAMEHGL